MIVAGLGIAFAIYAISTNNDFNDYFDNDENL